MSKVVLKGGRFVWEGGYKTKELPKQSGFRWDSVSRHWWTDNPVVARNLFDFADYKSRVAMGSPAPDGIDDYKDIVLEALRMLAGVCDYARMEDGQGFSKSDAYVGHDLASKQSLTAEQAALGLPLIRRHKRQLPEWMVAVLNPFIDAVNEEVKSNG